MGGGSGDDQATRAQDVRRAEGAAGGGIRGPRMNGYTRMNAYGCRSWSSKAAGEDDEGGGREVGRIDFLWFGRGPVKKRWLASESHDRCVPQNIILLKMTAPLWYLECSCQTPHVPETLATR